MRLSTQLSMDASFWKMGVRDLAGPVCWDVSAWVLRASWDVYGICGIGRYFVALAHGLMVSVRGFWILGIFSVRAFGARGTFHPLLRFRVIPVWHHYRLEVDDDGNIYIIYVLVGYTWCLRCCGSHGENIATLDRNSESRPYLAFYFSIVAYQKTVSLGSFQVVCLAVPACCFTKRMCRLAYACINTTLDPSGADLKPENRLMTRNRRASAVCHLLDGTGDMTEQATFILDRKGPHYPGAKLTSQNQHSSA